MIIDKISNADFYNNIPQHAIDFIKKLTPKIEPGKYLLSETDYANIETYNTKNLSDAKFEAHKNYIDIQILVSGVENIYYNDIENLKVGIDYNPEKDIIFYSDNIGTSNYVTLNGTNFVMIFPHEAHAPQVAYDNISLEVKKVVLKIKV